MPRRNKTTASAVVTVTLLLSACSSENESTITASDVARAADLQLWKIDYSSLDPLYGFRIVVLDGNEDVIAAGSMIGGQIPMNKDRDSTTITVSCHKDGPTVTGKFWTSSAAIHYEFDKVFDSKGWCSMDPPILNGNFYHLAADSEIVRIGKTPFQEDGHILALEVLRAPLDSKFATKDETKATNRER